MNPLNHIRNFLRIDDRLATSGMPQPADFERFTRVLDACAGQRVFVHCAANKRVSAFVFLHRLSRGTDRGAAESDLNFHGGELGAY
ncbi:MAG: hypothetical protein EPO07_17930 [Verrucomicrobia bacterium]|nr:MAG: hypothetical protein EPO07_17930 [Verrucomicrobiota bacterium]